MKTYKIVYSSGVIQYKVCISHEKYLQVQTLPTNTPEEESAYKQA